MKDLTWEQALTLLSPHSYGLVSTLGPTGRPNLMGVGWWTVVSWNPRMVAVAIGKERYTRRCLEHCPEFVLCFPGVEQVRGAWLCGTVSGSDSDKFPAAGFTPVPARTVRPPLVGDSTLAFECRVRHQLECGDHVLYVGDVLAIRGTPEKPMHLYTIHYRRPVGIDHELNLRTDLKTE